MLGAGIVLRRARSGGGPVALSAMADPRAEIPPHRYTAAFADRIELAWQDRWEHDGTFLTPNPVGDLSQGFAEVADRPKLYVLDMFPYPSGVGLTSATRSATSVRTSTPATSG